MDDMAIAKGNRYPHAAIPALREQAAHLAVGGLFCSRVPNSASGGRDLRSQIGLGGSSSSVDAT